ncbi:hypothetical protein DL98DRAFT_632606 [Cadophora sp. DSE1049]|nr:hypothetical protein DL98DRAFT_632606 [Cadophora sp. DSE1049]
MSTTREGTLEDHFSAQTPPSRGVDIVKFWKALFCLLDELKAIQTSGIVYSNVSPESILVVKDGSDDRSPWRFTFSDLDFNATGSSKSVTGRNLSDYDPPEVFMSYKHGNPLVETAPEFSWAADIWSLGCIYSEAAIWIADGYLGLQEYRFQRQAETNNAFPHSNTISPFHDGTKILRSVLDAHLEIEDRLRRSDNITKNVLDMMVQEMLWEEDRPSAKALLRKSEGVLMKAKQKSGVGAGSGNGNEMVRLGSRHRREYPPPDLPSPTQPLPPVPKRAAPTLKSVPGKNGSREVVSGISHDRVFDPRARSPATGDEPARLKPLNGPGLQQNGNGTVLNSRTDRERVRELTSRDPPSHSSAKQSTIPFQTTHTNSNMPHRPIPNQGRPRALRTQNSHEFASKLTNPQDRKYNREHYAKPTVLRAPDDLPPATQTLSVDRSTSQSRFAQSYHEPQGIVPARAESFSSNHQSSTYSQPISSPTSQDDSFLDALSYVPTADEIPQETKPSKRGIGFSLFPSRSRNEPSSHHTRVHDLSLPKSPSLSSAAVVPNLEYISLNTCLEWKKANKKVKKHANVPPLLSVAMMEELSGRDHRVFEALSYLVKGMSPEGTELFFTISYDTYRRKDTSELCTHLSTHPLKRETNIFYRLNLQLQAYRLMLLRAKTPPKTKSKKPPTVPFIPAKVRPLSMYILTNGEWGGEGDGGVEEVQDVMRTMEEFLKSEGLDTGSVSVQFVSFGGSAGAMRRMGGLGRESSGNEGLAVDCERWTGNVVRMLRGALDACKVEGGINGSKYNL